MDASTPPALAASARASQGAASRSGYAFETPPPPTAAALQPHAPATDPAADVLAFGDRVRGMSPADRAREIFIAGALEDANGAVASDTPRTDPGPAHRLRLAIALTQTRAPNDLARAQQLVQKVVDSQHPDAEPLKPLARLLATRLAEQRRVEYQLEKLTQQTREQQRRIDQLSQRLEAVRAIERSITPTPRPPPVAPAPDKPAAGPTPATPPP